MNKIERLHEAVTHAPTPEELQRRAAQGWRLVGVEWERGAPGTDQAGELQETPFGLKVAPDCAHLETDPDESQALAAMLRLVIQDEVSFTQVAQELNRRGFPRFGLDPGLGLPPGAAPGRGRPAGLPQPRLALIPVPVYGLTSKVPGRLLITKVSGLMQAAPTLNRYAPNGPA
jgi:hypothetical protein